MGRVAAPTSRGGGFIVVFQQKDPDHYVLLDKAPTSIGARTGTYYVGRDRVYLVVGPAN
jgi:hypothetical protein